MFLKTEDERCFSTSKQLFPESSIGSFELFFLLDGLFAGSDMKGSD